MHFLLAGLADDQFDRDLQILGATGDVGITRGAAGLAVVLVIHGPAVEAVACERVQRGILALARHVEIEHPRRHGRTVDEEHDRSRRLARLGRADPLAKHPQRNVALPGPVFAAPDFTALRFDRRRSLRRHRRGRRHAKAKTKLFEHRASRDLIPGVRHDLSPRHTIRYIATSQFASHFHEPV
jgi:hypothetical protein